MQRRGAQFTIRGLMIAVLIVAGVLALPDGARGIGVVLLLPCLALFAAWRLRIGGHRRLAAALFWGLAIPVNILFATVCTIPGVLSLALFYLWLFVLLPTMAGFGVVWADLVTKPGAVPQRSNWWAWLGVIALTVLPGLTSFTLWPFQLRFLAARGALERLADQVEAGQSISFPQYAGPFRLVGSKVDTQTWGVALLLDPDPNGPSGFVRHKNPRDGPYGCYAPIRGDWWHLGLGGGWCYHEED